MATIREVIGRIDDSKPNAFENEDKVRWLSLLDGKIAADVMMMSITEIQQFNYSADDMDRELLVSFPHDDIYDYWLMAQIDLANGETDKYQNSAEVYNAAYSNFVRWFANTYAPAQGYPRRSVYE